MKNPAVTETGTGNSPGALVRHFREYLSVHPGITLSGHDMDTMALEMARIALPIQESTQAMAQHDDAGGRSEAEIVQRTEEAARFLLRWKYGMKPEAWDALLRHSRNAKAQWAWAAACQLQEILTDSDAVNAAQEVDDEEVAVPETLEPAASLIPLAVKHSGMKVDYRGMLRQTREHINPGGAGYAEMLRQLEAHLQELGQRWYSGDLSVVDELLQLYCVETELRNALVKGGAV